MKYAVIIVAFTLAACPARAQELSLLGGTMHDSETRHRSYAWQLDYRERRGEYFAFGLSYLNEGHVPNHHRDGGSGQIWACASALDRRLSLAAGAGPYYYFDTARASEEAPYTDDHGWGAITSLAATWYAENRWFFHLRTNRVDTRRMDTVTTVFGIGYRLEAPSSPGQPVTAPYRRGTATRNEIAVFLGRTIVNSFGSEHSVAKSVEYRRSLWQYVDWTVGWLDEGENGMTHRDGPVTQLWAVKDFFGDRLALGIGGGAYYALDHQRDPQNGKDNDRFLTGIFTLTAGYWFHPHWGLRISWDRVNTNYNRDTDVVKAGIGYRF